MPLPNSTAEAVVAVAQAGDQDAIADLLSQVTYFVRRTATKYARRFPAADLEEMYQAGMIAAAQSIESYVHAADREWRAYGMAAAARGVAREAHRATRLAERFPVPDAAVECDALPAVPQWHDGAEHEVANVQSALEELDPVDRAVVELSHGLTGRRVLEGGEVAARLGLRARQVPVILQRAQERLRQILADRGFGGDGHAKA